MTQILQAISKYLTEHHIPHKTYNDSIGIHPEPYLGYTSYKSTIFHDHHQTITIKDYLSNAQDRHRDWILGTTNETTLNLADPDLLPKILQTIQQTIE